MADVHGRALCPGSIPGVPIKWQESEVGLNDKKNRRYLRITQRLRQKTILTFL